MKTEKERGDTQRERESCHQHGEGEAERGRQTTHMERESETRVVGRQTDREREREKEGGREREGWREGEGGTRTEGNNSPSQCLPEIVFFLQKLIFVTRKSRHQGSRLVTHFLYFSIRNCLFYKEVVASGNAPGEPFSSIRGLREFAW